MVVMSEQDECPHAYLLAATLESRRLAEEIPLRRARGFTCNGMERDRNELENTIIPKLSKMVKKANKVRK